HDGVRPLLPAKLVDRIMKAVKKYQAVITGIEVTDTIKEVAEDGLVIDTPSRDKLWAIQTPQAFLYEIIMKAHREVPDRLKVTDDASLLEEIGVAVKVIKGSKKNIKITRPLDMVLAERLLQDEESKR
ncbi:MAG TPA: 2-C-methyl-D-erythritol 4-phosphate cytidylyltransferase, partial [Halanaerobiales bacterium]|nr:2-C-methyl-D-erythritol 4-phosphate cytidylyltransferase [Halanaerobiales bacterium]